MTFSNKLRFYYDLSVEKSTLYRAIRVAILVGIILNLINNPSIFLSFSLQGVHLGRALLTFLVPYCVSTYSSVLSQSSMKPGKTSLIDATLKCRNCGETTTHIHIGEKIEECAKCGKKTKWSISRLFSHGISQKEELKSLALFARHNPQPLFRVNTRGSITDANSASEKLLQDEDLPGTNLCTYFPELNHLNFKTIIDKEQELHVVTSVRDRDYNFVLKGVKEINTVHIYGNDITDIKQAEKKIRKQAKSIDESLQYAWYIQKAMLPSKTFVQSVFPECFIFFRPRDIVSGDFYWVNQIGHLKIAAVADCTGHGVPGAMISMMGISLLNEIILRDQVLEPDKILNVLRERLVSSLASADQSSGISDGMDIALVIIDTVKKTYCFAGAFNPLMICRKEELIILKADRMPIGKHVIKRDAFKIKEMEIVDGDRLFLFTDGYKDQFGKDNFKKFSSKSFKNLITGSNGLSMPEVYRKFETEFDNWKQNTEQIDDVTVMGIEVNT